MSLKTQEVLAVLLLMWLGVGKLYIAKEGAAWGWPWFAVGVLLVGRFVWGMRKYRA